MENKSNQDGEGLLGCIGLIIIFILVIAYYIGAGTAIYNALGGGRLGIRGVVKLL